MRKPLLISLVLGGALGLALPAQASAPACAASVDSLRALLGEPQWPLAWDETTMRDGRPLQVSLNDRAGRLHIAFVKTGEGLWAEGEAVVCRGPEGTEARFGPGGLRVTPAANWLLRLSFQGSGTVGLHVAGPRLLRITAPGWRGDFAPGSTQVGLRAP